MFITSNYHVLIYMTGTNYFNLNYKKSKTYALKIICKIICYLICQLDMKKCLYFRRMRERVKEGVLWYGVPAIKVETNSLGS